MIRAIVVYYNGKEVPDSTVDRIVTTLVENGIATEGGINVSILEPEDISKIVVPSIIRKYSKVKTDVDNEKAIKAACKLIKDTFNSSTSNNLTFAIKLTDCVALLKKENQSSTMLTAIKVISEAGAECIKYGLSSDVINIIKQVNENL